MTNSDKPKSNSVIRVMLVMEGSKVMVPPVEFNCKTQPRKEVSPPGSAGSVTMHDSGGTPRGLFAIFS